MDRKRKSAGPSSPSTVYFPKKKQDMAVLAVKAARRESREEEIRLHNLDVQERQQALSQEKAELDERLKIGREEKRTCGKPGAANMLSRRSICALLSVKIYVV